MDLKGTYYRWAKTQAIQAEGGGTVLVADILGAETNVVADPPTGMVHVSVPDRPINADEARMIGVRLIEAAALADNGRSVRGE